ncbi:hypothetical protein BU24DRAFT_464201 [Aaosphaeria arxii CBS 175.79]|uniref:DUF7730 domain-containing protein n=1 Tax=Aaosphaeria arxii CBS 175.79 TaxID=1450172 RepID=A0A6A5XJH1_9PLEO|nr:uncharacterized protein BU24DRAFT_464201 [Aaosphaeria arxii CBS 175.79]KAF2013418.1 hypothetical protein BU24DRAFT_464201 [Aaosphaeria arxii CBS 175.79]
MALTERPRRRSSETSSRSMIAKGLNANLVVKSGNDSRPPMKKRRNGMLDLRISIKSPRFQISRENSLGSPLLRLPAEIRCKIYEYALGGYDISIVRRIASTSGNATDFLSFYDGVEIPRGSRSIEKPNIGLLRVSRQIYVETALLPYVYNTFCFDLALGNSTFTPWMKARRPAQRRAVHCIRLHYRHLVSIFAERRKPLRAFFPNLKYIDGTDYMVKYMVKYIAPASASHLEARIRDAEGDDVRLILQPRAQSPVHTE